jgi:hypothetical protein
VVLGFFALLTLATWFEWSLPAGRRRLMRALFGAGGVIRASTLSWRASRWGWP